MLRGFRWIRAEDGGDEFLPAFIALGEADFAFDAGNAVEEKLAEVGEGRGGARGDAVGGDKAEELAEGVVDVIDGVELAGKGGDGGVDLVGFENVALGAGVEGTEGGVGRAAEHGAAAAVGEREGAAGRSGRRYLARRIRVRGFHGSS